MAGYSGKPLIAKLGIKEGFRVAVVSSPVPYEQLVGPLPPGAAVVANAATEIDLVHLFVTKREDLDRELRRWRTRIAQAAAVWVSWPKRSSKVATDITEDVIREVALPMGFVDIKVCAVDDTW